MVLRSANISDWYDLSSSFVFRGRNERDTIYLWFLIRNLNLYTILWSIPRHVNIRFTTLVLHPSFPMNPIQKWQWTNCRFMDDDGVLVFKVEKDCVASNNDCGMLYPLPMKKGDHSLGEAICLLQIPPLSVWNIGLFRLLPPIRLDCCKKVRNPSIENATWAPSCGMMMVHWIVVRVVVGVYGIIHSFWSVTMMMMTTGMTIYVPAQFDVIDRTEWCNNRYGNITYMKWFLAVLCRLFVEFSWISLSFQL